MGSHGAFVDERVSAYKILVGSVEALASLERRYEKGAY